MENSVKVDVGRFAKTMNLRQIEDLWDSLGSLAERYNDTTTPDEFVDLALDVPKSLPSELYRSITTFRRYAPDGDVLLLRGLLPNHVTPPATVRSSSALPSEDVVKRAALLLVGVMTLFGEPFNYSSLWEGRLVQNLIPVEGREFYQTSQSSRGMLDWHVEDGFREDRCDYAGLLCIRGDPAGISQYAQARDLRLSPELEAVLRESRFQVRPDPAHELPGEVEPRRLPVLTGPDWAPEIVYDTHHIEPIEASDAAAIDALKKLHLSLDEIRGSHAMTMGDMLIFDNKRVVHSRTPFTARFDGSDRWLIRTMVCGSTVTFRRWGDRIPK